MSSKARILFVDDEKRVLNSMRGLFRREFELFLTTTGTDAIKIASENSIDVVVADQRMPGMTGIEVLGKVKQLSPNTVRILLTGYADPEAVEGSINIGEVFRFLSKPCSPKILRDTLKLAVAASHTNVTASRASQPTETSAATPVSRQNVTNIGDHPAVRRQSNSGVPPKLVPVTIEKQAPNPQRAVGESTPDDTATGLASSEQASSASGSRPSPVASDLAAKTSEETPPVAGGESVPKNHSGSHWQDSTTIVLSGDTSREFRTPDITAGRRSGFEQVGVIFFTVDPKFAEAALRAASSDRRVTLATTLAKVAEAIERKEAGVLVTDLTANKQVLQRMISALKQMLPELVTIVASDGRDTTDMISLINHGQVFRYILKPIEPKKLMFEINAAAIKHLDMVDNPDLARRHQVVEMANGGNSDKPLSAFVTRLRNFRPGQAGPSDSST